MLAYLANRAVVGTRRSSPNALLLVISVHVAFLAAVMSAKMDLPPTIKHPPIDIFWVPKPKAPPPPNLTAKPSNSRPTSDWIDHQTTKESNQTTGDLQIDKGGATIDVGPVAGGGAADFPPIPIATPVHQNARLLTPPSELKPPYPPSKIVTEEEAVLRLRLTIDDRGRVVAVDPVGRADSAFLEAARRHLMAHWRYQPATEDGRVIASTTTITLRFRLNG